MKILVCGGRDFDDWETLCRTLNNLYLFHQPPNEAVNFSIIEGGASGADFLARVWAKWRYLPFREYKADWKKYGGAAGPIRNQQMLDEGKPDLVVAFPGGRGTMNMIELARKAGVEVRIIEASD